MPTDLPQDLIFRHFLRSVRRNVAEQMRHRDPSFALESQEDKLLDNALAALRADARPEGPLTASTAQSHEDAELHDACLANALTHPESEPPQGHYSAQPEIGKDGQDELAGRLFKIYWQGYQNGSQGLHSEEHQESAMEEMKQGSKLSTDQGTEALLSSWYKAGLTLGTTFK